MAEPLEATLMEMGKALDELRVAFDLYFQGMERLPPVDHRTRWVSSMRRLREETKLVKNTALKFRVQTMWAKFQTYDILWNRVLREIEEGTYKRDRFKVALRNRERKQVANGEERPDAYELDDLDVDFDMEGLMEEAAASVSKPQPPRGAPASPAAAAAAAAASPGGALAAFLARTGKAAGPGAPPAGASAAGIRGAPAPAAGVPGVPPRPAAARPTAAPAPGARPAPLPAAARPAPPQSPPPSAAARPAPPRPASPPPGRAPPPPARPAPGARAPGDLSDDYVRRIERTLSEARRRVGDRTETNFDTLKAQLTKQVPVIKQQHGAKSVEFQVVIKDGKAVLKAIPRK